MVVSRSDGDAERHQVVLHGLGALGAEREVVLDGAALVAVAFDLGRARGFSFSHSALARSTSRALTVELVGVVGEVDVLQDAVLFGTEATLVAIEARRVR